MDPRIISNVTTKAAIAMFTHSFQPFAGKRLLAKGANSLIIPNFT